MIPELDLAPPRYSYMTVREVGVLLEKRKSRIYAMVSEGLLEDVGFIVIRDAKRIWIGVPASFMGH